MTDWPFTLRQVATHKPCVLVTLNRIAGSAPRESGSRMIVTVEDVHGSIGGGNLEFTSIARARDLLAASTAARQLHESYGLGPELNQCCGGAVTLLYEVLAGSCPAWVEALARAWDRGEDVVLAQAVDSVPPLRSVIWFRGSGEPPVPPQVRDAARVLLEQIMPDSSNRELPCIDAGGATWWLERLAPTLQPLYLYGAGHVGREVARLLERLPFRVRWIDARAGEFPATIGGHVTPVLASDPVYEAAHAEPTAIHVVMTHSHALDEEICAALLQRADFLWVGLIGSDSKRRRFVHRLAKRGIADDRLQRLVCPIGLGGIRGKQPATIAVSLVAQLMMEKPWMPADN